MSYQHYRWGGVLIPDQDSEALLKYELKIVIIILRWHLT